MCSDPSHVNVINIFYDDIVSALSESAILARESKRVVKKLVIGWNKHVARAHEEARLKFRLWVRHGKPTSGTVYNNMCNARRRFKSRLKWCQNNETIKWTN